MKKNTNRPVMQVVGAGPGPGLALDVADDPRVTAAARKLAEAEAAQAKRTGAVRVAQAKLAEARDAAPVVSARAARAEQAVTAAREAAQDAAGAVANAKRRLADTEGELEARQARLADVEDGTKSNDPSDVVAARVAVEKVERAVAACEATLIAAEEDATAREAEVAAAEQQLDQVRAEPDQPAASVVAAEVAVADAEAALTRSREATEQARRDHAAAIRAAEADAAQAGAGVEQLPVTPYFASLDVFVDQLVLPCWTHRNEGREVAWCHTWWRHTEAVTRLEALWEAFEAMRLQPAPAMSTWFWQHFDPHMRMLSDPNGVFHACSAQCGVLAKTVHHPETRWPSQPAPEGLFEQYPDAHVQRDGTHPGEETA